GGGGKDGVGEYGGAAARRTWNCAPAEGRGHSGPGGKFVGAGAVSSRARPWSHPATSVAPIALLSPGISIMMVAEGFPESRNIIVHELDPSNPFRAFP